MYLKSCSTLWATVFCLALAVLVGAPAAAQDETVCDENARAAFANAVESGASEDELEAQFGHCRTNEAEPVCTTAAGTKSGSGLTATSSAIQVITNFNTFFERMTGCGYHPQAELVACNVEIRQRGGYGGFPGGTFEHVLFCFDCDRNGVFEFTTRGFVHVTDNVAVQPTPSWYHLAYATTFAAPPICTTNNGGQGNVRAILSWAAQPANCFSTPFWGNRIDFTNRRDP